MAQSRTASFLEAMLNQSLGLLTANLTWWYILVPIFHFTNPSHDVLVINLIYLVVSLVRSFLFRRFFNWLEVTGRLK